DPHDVGEVLARERAHVAAVARQGLEVVRRLRAVVESGGVPLRLSGIPRLLALDAAAVHRAVDDVIAPELEAGAIEKAQHPVIAPVRIGADLANAVPERPGLQLAEQPHAGTAAL